MLLTRLLTTLAHLVLTKVPISTLGPGELVQSCENMKRPEVVARWRCRSHRTGFEAQKRSCVTLRISFAKYVFLTRPRREGRQDQIVQ